MAFLHFLELQLTTERENIGETGKGNVRECPGEDVRGREELVKGKGGWMRDKVGSWRRAPQGKQHGSGAGG